MRTVGAALGGALVAGVVMFAVGTHAARDPLAGITGAPPAVADQVPGAPAYGIVQYGAQPYAIAQPAMVPGVVQSVPGAQPIAYAAPTPVRAATRPQVVRERVIEREPIVVRRGSGRSWAKTALVIGGSSATGAGVGAIAGGRKGALVGAALGGGVASIFEASKRP